VGDHNYGEGSSREHAAMDPVFWVSSCFSKIVCNAYTKQILKKTRMLGLIFADEVDYDKIQEDDTINFLDLVELHPAKP
jgi:aconitate hydratase